MFVAQRNQRSSVASSCPLPFELRNCARQLNRATRGMRGAYKRQARDKTLLLVVEMRTEPECPMYIIFSNKLLQK